MMVARFNADGVVGTITLSQANATAVTLITVELSGLDASLGPFPWHVHERPLTGTCLSSHYNVLDEPLTLCIR